MNSEQSIGSKAWKGADELAKCSEKHTRSESFLKKIKWELLEQRASKARNGISCTINEGHSAGHYNMVRRINFEDGVSWVARLRMPELVEEFRMPQGLPVEQIIKVEVATMEYLREKLTIRIPTVHDHESDEKNEVGAAYILMDYIDGITAAERKESDNQFDTPAQDEKLPSNQFGTAYQDQNFRQRLAEIQVELASLHFDKIGGLEHVGQEFKIGPDVETGLGPWDTAEKYYRVLASSLLLAIRKHPHYHQLAKGSDLLLRMFPTLMSHYGAQNDKFPGGFGLVNGDFGAHNVLVDEEFNIVGLIDFDWVVAAPIDCVAQLPTFIGAEREIPGYTDNRDGADERTEQRARRVCEYEEMLSTTMTPGQTHSSVQSIESRLAERITSNGALIVSALTDHFQNKGLEGPENGSDAWIHAFKILLVEWKASTNDGRAQVEELIEWSSNSQNPEVEKNIFVEGFWRTKKGCEMVVRAIDWDSKEVLDRLEGFKWIVPDVEHDSRGVGDV